MAKDNIPQKRTNKRTTQFKQTSPIKKILKVCLWAVGLIILTGGALFTFYASTAPHITKNALISDNSPVIYGKNNQIITRLSSQNQDYVKSAKIPTTLKKAIISIEDRRFYKHHGIDPIRIAGAAVSNITGSSLGLQGGSTLTQQLIKLSVFSTKVSDQTLKRKAQEAWLAIKLEKKYSKDQILEFYINKVYMNNGVTGMQTAAEYYFNKPLSQLSLAQLALLAGMPQSPVRYDPYNYPGYATKRRDEVLNAMVETKAITQTQANQAKAVSVKQGLVKVHNQEVQRKKNTKYIDSYLKETLSELKKRGYKLNSGLKIYTNLDMKSQRKLYNTVNNDTSIYFPNDNFQVGATLVDPNNGKILAMQGNRKTKIQFGLNRAVQTDRSSGSTAKPIMDYGPAIEYLKYPTYQPVRDTPYVYPGTDKSLMDFDNKYQGTITMEKALIESRNIPAIRTLENVGMDNATKFLAKLGMTFKEPLQTQNGIGLYISSSQLAAAYAAFANGGTYYRPYLINKITTSNGESHKFKPKGKRAMSTATAFMITAMLKGVMTDSNGSGKDAKVAGLFEAGKTGTTQYPSDKMAYVPGDAAMDAWFSGYTKNYSLAIWTGYDHQFEAGNYISYPQTKISQQIYRNVMGSISQGKPNVDWKQPADVSNAGQGYFVTGYPGIGADNSSQTAGSYTVSGNNNSTTTDQGAVVDRSKKEDETDDDSATTTPETGESVEQQPTTPDTNDNGNTVTPPVDNNATPEDNSSNSDSSANNTDQTDSPAATTDSSSPDTTESE